MENKFTLELPTRTDATEKLSTNSSVLFIGANGSGKTRLGAWIDLESPQYEKVHRISAQKSLSMPDTTTSVSIEKAEKSLLCGYADYNGDGVNYKYYKQNQRWQQKPAISLLNDYEKLMIYLFSDQIEENAKYYNAAKASEERIEPPATKLNKVKEVWEKILPHRELIITGLAIKTKVRNSPENIYNSSEMSDGERVIFYLIGQCLAAPQDGIIVIDEPEIHLHKSIQAPLWAEIEKLRPDCLFVYITHDVDFAAAQESAEKIWLKSYDGNNWDWQRIEKVDGLPEELLLQILGSRKKVVFVEGENGSFDVSLYRSLLSNFLVIPQGSCKQVIQSVKALKASNQLHHLQIYGIIDRDRRVENEIRKLLNDGIYVLEVAEVENLFLTPEILEFVSEKLSNNPEDDFQKVSNFVFKELKKELETQTSLRTVGEIKFKLNLFEDKSKSETKLKEALEQLVADIDISLIYNSNKSFFEEIINTKDYSKLLKYYNRKSLAKRISGCFGLKDGELGDFVVRLAKGSHQNEIKNRLKQYFGQFSSHMD
jgi:energy-coupling factor transporter ATP-binding protein EcfA2